MAIGLRKTQMLWIILLPQALTAMLPAVLSQLVVIVKDTALGGQLLIAYPELLRSGRDITANYGNTVATYIIIAIDLHRPQLRADRLRPRRGALVAAPATAAEATRARRMMEMIESGVVPGGVAATTRLGERSAASGGSGRGERIADRRTARSVGEPPAHARWLQRAISVARDSRMTVTRTWPG